MVYTCQYQSPMGDILLAADEIGLTGLWFVGKNTLPTYFRMNILCGKHRFLQSPKGGWMCIFPAKNRILHRLCI